MAWTARAVYDLFERYHGDAATVRRGPLAAFTPEQIRSKVRRLGLDDAPLPLNAHVLTVLRQEPGLTAGMLAARMKLPVATAVLALQLLFCDGRAAVGFNVVHGMPVVWLHQAAPLCMQLGVWACASRDKYDGSVICIISKGKKHTKTLRYSWEDFTNIASLRELAKAHTPDVFDNSLVALQRKTPPDSRGLELSHLDLTEV